MTNEEEIAKLRTEMAVLKAELSHVNDANKELNKNHQSLQEKHHKLADGTSTHIGLSNLLHIIIPFLGVAGFIFNNLGKKSNENKLLNKVKDICNNCQEQTEVKK
jgi:hypothetical protein